MGGALLSIARLQRPHSCICIYTRMGKTRFSSLDVTIAVRDLRAKALGLRVANVYDINARTYLIKLARPVRIYSAADAVWNFNFLVGSRIGN